LPYGWPPLFLPVLALQQAARVLALQQAARVLALQQAARVLALQQAARVLALQQAARVLALLTRPSTPANVHLHPLRSLDALDATCMCAA